MSPKEVELAIATAGKEAVTDGVVRDLSVFHSSIGVAQLKRQDYLEVSNEIFEFLANGQETRYIMYGNPAVKIYREGTREQHEALDRMGIDDYAREIAKQKAEGK